VKNDLAPGLCVFASQAEGSRAATSYAAPQLGARVRALPWLHVKGSFGRAVRVPSTIELFGDCAFLLARPSLRPESSLGGDAGAVVDLRRRVWALLIEAAYFEREVSDYIAIVPSGYAAAAINVGDEHFRGVEARARFQLGANLALTADYTFVHSANGAGGAYDGADGKAIPGVPAHKLGVRAEVRGGPFGLAYDVIYTGDVWRNAQNTPGSFIPARALHGLAAHAGPFPGWPLVFTVEVRNLADLRVVDIPLGGSANQGRTAPYPLVDFYDYPLPGRAVYATLAFNK
jgi:outer membrane receptor protein involved in Fe transport